MKTTKLVSLTALAGAALMAIAPIAGVNAATGFKVNEDGSAATATSDNLNTKIPSSGVADQGVATSATKNDQSGTATAKSDVWAHVINGWLTLDAVPDLYFGNVTPSSVAGLVSNKSLRDNDGNETGLLQVTDSRVQPATTDPKADAVNGLGYTLGVSMSKFTQFATEEDARDNTNGTAAVTGWKLDLNKEDGLTDTTSAALTTPTLNTVNLDDSDSAKNLISAQPNTGFGSVQHLYNKQTSASLHVPSTATEGYYAATLTWTLSAKAPSANA